MAQIDDEGGGDDGQRVHAQTDHACPDQLGRSGKNDHRHQHPVEQAQPGFLRQYTVGKAHRQVAQHHRQRTRDALQPNTALLNLCQFRFCHNLYLYHAIHRSMREF